jgi:hypothetical protein
MTGPGPLLGGVNSFSPSPSHPLAEKLGSGALSAANAGRSAGPAQSNPIMAPAKAIFDIGFSSDCGGGPL